MEGFIDIHCHVLPGLDDGPGELSQALQMIHMARAHGTEAIVATPHVRGMRQGLRREIQRLARLLSLRAQGYPLYVGADVEMGPWLLRLSPGELPLLNGQRYLLLEPSWCTAQGLKQAVFALRLKGVEPLITHPERNPFLRQHLEDLRALAVPCQLTAQSLTGQFGRAARRAALRMIELGLACAVASDAHDTTSRPPVLREAFRLVRESFGLQTAQRLFIENPGLILQGLPVKGA
jgi:protein-tyrosine phosphatase